MASAVEPAISSRAVSSNPLPARGLRPPARPGPGEPGVGLDGHAACVPGGAA